MFNETNVHSSKFFEPWPCLLNFMDKHPIPGIKLVNMYETSSVASALFLVLGDHLYTTYQMQSHRDSAAQHQCCNNG